MADLSAPPTMRQLSRRDVVLYGSGSSSSRDLHSSRPPPPPPSDLRCYSASYVYSSPPFELQRQQPTGASKVSSFRGGFSLSDPELQRKKRVATYRFYSMKGKMRNSLKKSFRWAKDKYNNVMYGFR